MAESDTNKLEITDAAISGQKDFLDRFYTEWMNSEPMKNLSTFAQNSKDLDGGKTGNGSGQTGYSKLLVGLLPQAQNLTQRAGQFAGNIDTQLQTLVKDWMPSWVDDLEKLQATVNKTEDENTKKSENSF
ncbi:hypothetical protein [Saccharopolyspora shandongensis]|uniref:hypothetical protein n=1 Tax=Saccharopolyspora shandongensis TaxID=418495 RepID=UPI0034111AA2